MKYGSILILCMATFLAAVPATADEGIEDTLAKIQHYEVGQDNAPMQYLIGRVLEVQGMPEARTALAERLAQVLATDASVECKKFICRQIYIIGTDAQIPALEPLLTDRDLTTPARYALKNLPGETATMALMSAVAASDGLVRVGLINDLGERHDTAALPLLRNVLVTNDAAATEAALNALAEISGDEALCLLRGALPGAAEAYLAGLQNLQRATRSPATGMQYAALYGPNYPDPVRMAAMAGMVRSGHFNALPAVLDALRNPDERWYRLGLGSVRALSGAKATRTLVNLMDNLSAERQADLLLALADPRAPERGAASSARKAALRALRAERPTLRVAGAQALAHLGNCGSVKALVEAAASGGDVQAPARQALAALRGEDISNTILRQLDGAAPTEAAELVRALSARRATEAVPALLRYAKTGRPETQTSAFDALGSLAGKAEMKDLTALLLAAGDDGTRDAARRALVSVARRLPANEEPVLEIVQAAQLSSNPYHVAICYAVLGAVGDPAGLDVLRSGLECPHAVIRDAALDALAGWPTGAPLEALLDFAKGTDDEELRARAVAGCVRMARMPSERPVEQTIPLLDELSRLSPEEDTKRGVLAALGGLKGPDALAMATAFLDDEALAADAAVAVEKIRKQGYRATASNAADQVGKALDGDMSTRWSTSAVQTPGQWFQVDVGYNGSVGGVVLNATPSPGDYPRGYEVYVFSDPENMGTPVATGAGEAPLTEITFPPVEGRYVRIVQTGADDGLWWSIHEMRLIAK